MPSSYSVPYPTAYDCYVSNVNATSSVLEKNLSADDLMLTVTEEYEHRVLKSKSGKKDDNTAFYCADSEKGQKGGSSSDVNSNSKNIGCHNCLKKGHYKLEERKVKGRNRKGRGKAKPKVDEKKERGAVTETKCREKEVVEGGVVER